MTTRKTFTPAFKLEIAKLMVDENYLCPLGYTIKQACEASGAGETAVKRWRQQYLAELAGKPLPNAQALTPEQQEIQQLKQRIRQLETEKDILKKASAFYAPEGIFAKEMR